MTLYQINEWLQIIAILGCFYWIRELRALSKEHDVFIKEMRTELDRSFNTHNNTVRMLKEIEKRLLGVKNG